MESSQLVQNSSTFYEHEKEQTLTESQSSRVGGRYWYNLNLLVLKIWLFFIHIDTLSISPLLS